MWGAQVTSASPGHKHNAKPPLRPRSSFAGLLAFALWIAAEILAFNLLAAVTGGGLAFFLLVMKSVVGFVVVQRVVRRKLSDLVRRGGVVIRGGQAAEAWLKGIGGVLLVAPGFVTGLAGLALLTPSIRRAIAGGGAGRAGPRDIDLPDADWREVPPEPRERIRRPGPAGER
jgi:UPF0716 protein FxsA